jgi:hypothetical protein
MKKKDLLGILAAGGLTLAISCDGGSSATSAGLAANDCQYGTFRPAGLADCVFPASDVNNQPFGVSDNRCAFGQPAIPPQCVSDAGERAYLSTSSKCATGYRFLPGACNRNDGPMTGFGTGTAGASTGIAFPVGNAAGAGGSLATGEAGSFGTGTGGSDVAGMAGGIGGTGGGIGGTSGASGTGGSANAGGVDASDGAAE